MKKILQFTLSSGLLVLLFTALLLSNTACKNAAKSTETTVEEAPTQSAALPAPALQLWSVRDSMGENPKATLEGLAKMGYKSVEGFGYTDGKFFGLTVDEFKTELDKNGLSMPSLHYGMSINDFADGQLSENAKMGVDVAKKLGARYLVCPYLVEEERGKTEEIKSLLVAMADYCSANGIRFAYHNHDFEFTTKAADGRMLMEHILEAVPAEKMAIEMDVYWVSYAGENPVEWMEKYPGRFELWHVKDMAKTEKRETVEVGDGSLDFPTIFAAAKTAGLQVPIIELEQYKTNSMEGVHRALTNYTSAHLGE